MYLFVKTVSGNTLNLEVSPSDNIADLKARIQATEGYSVERIRLIHAGKELEDDLTVGDYNIVDESTVFMTLRLVGGGKVHGSLARAGKVKNQTPKVAKMERTGKTPRGRAKKRMMYNKRYVNVVLGPGGKKIGPNNQSIRAAKAESRK